MNSSAMALQDLEKSVLRLPLAMRLAIDDIQGKYRRTVLGPMWIALGQAATIAGFTLVFSGLFNTSPPEYALFLAAGLPVWSLVSTHLIEMPIALVHAKGYLESYEVPWLTHIWRRSFQYLLVFFHQIVTFFLVIALLYATGHTDLVHQEMLLAIPGLALVTFAGAGAGMFLSVFGARYRDLQHAMTILASLLFFLTPVIWRANQLSERAWIYHLNPLYYFVTIVREPLLGQAPSMDTWIIAGILSVVFFVLGFLSFSLSRGRLYHWL